MNNKLKQYFNKADKISADKRTFYEELEKQQFKIYCLQEDNKDKPSAKSQKASSKAHNQTFDDEVGDRLDKYEQKLNKASFKRSFYLDQERERIQNQNHHRSMRANTAQESQIERQRETLQRFCERQEKAQKLQKKLGKQKRLHIEEKRMQEEEKLYLIRMKMNEMKEENNRAIDAQIKQTKNDYFQELKVNHILKC